MPGDQTDLSAVADSLSKFAAANQIRFLDLRQHIMQSGGRDLYYPLDRHLTSRGHAVAAKVFSDKLLSDFKTLVQR
ncbi:MAG TPA: hypothetical protein VIH68_02295 [Bacteroidota bacterium]